MRVEVERGLRLHVILLVAVGRRGIFFFGLTQGSEVKLRDHYYFKYLFLWLHLVLVVVCWFFDLPCSMWDIVL